LHHFFLFGLLLWLIGYIGLFFGRLIKAAISRQREFLADAASVQFTRNPSALANALLKIMYADDRSWLLNLHAEDMSHLCFGETLHFSRTAGNTPPS
jgi:Zn-dependent protease with chaperone function